MEVKEMTGFDYINFLKSFKELVTREFCNPPGIRDVNKRIDEIIALLQRGKIDKEELKKYRQMWGELEMGNYDVWVATPGVFTNMHEFTNELKQKHFPKEAKSDGIYY